MRDIKLESAYPAEIDIKEDRIQTSGSLYNAVFLLLFTPPSWQNEFLQTPLTSKIPEIMGKTLTNQIRLDIIKEAERILAILQEKNSAGSVEVDAEIPKSGRLNLFVSIKQPDNELAYQLNWNEGVEL